MTATVRYQQLYDGERLLLKVGNSHTFSCCTCGLSHRFTVGKTTEHTVEVTIREDKRATAGRRRSREILQRIKELAR